jgi:hypothetical protein
MGGSITAVYRVANSIVATIDELDEPICGKRLKGCVSVVGASAMKWLPEAFSQPFRISDNRQRLEWPELGQSLRLSQLLNRAKATIYFIPWKASHARPEVRKQELVGCWRNAGGYALLESEGAFRQKLVGRGTAWDIAGGWRWTYRGPGEFETRRHTDGAGAATAGPIHTFRLSAYDGDTMILAVVAPFRFTDYEGTLQTAMLWTRSKPPKSWTASK